MLVRIYSEIIDLPNDSILFIMLNGQPTDEMPKIYPVKIYLRNGEVKEGHMTEYSMGLHYRLILNWKQLEVIHNLVDEHINEYPKYSRRLRSIFKFLKKQKNNIIKDNI